MRCAVFTGNGNDKLQRTVNDWLDAFQDVEIKFVKFHEEGYLTRDDGYSTVLIFYEGGYKRE